MNMKTTFIITAISLFVVLATSFSMAYAQEEVLNARFIEPNKKSKKEAPVLWVEFNAPEGKTEKDFLAQQLTGGDEPTVNATKAGTFGESSEKLFLVVLVQGNGDWMGNELYTNKPETDEQGQEIVNNGAWTGVRNALEKLGGALPQKGKGLGILLVYGNDVDKYDSGVIATGADFASSLPIQEKFEDAVSKDLSKGVKIAFNELISKRDSTLRKVLVIIGDGSTINIADTSMKSFRKKFDDAHVEVFTIYYQRKEDEDKTHAQTNMQRMEDLATGSDNYKPVVKIDNIAVEAGAFAKSIADKRYYVEFPGDKFIHDAKDYRFNFEVGKKREVYFADDDRKITTLKWKRPGSGGSSLWWLWFIVIPLIVILLLVIIVLAAKPAPEEVPPEYWQAPAPMMDQSLIMPNAQTAEGYPIVGWIVPLTGTQKFQTFQLMMGVTQIGGGPGAQIHIDDRYLSDIHAEIVCTAAGFTLNDANSKNGIKVNERKVTSHELIDNDGFVMGETEFKFKTIN